MLNGVITNATGWRSHKLQGYVNFQGLAISIENERGSYRQGIDDHGKPWRTFMHIAYGRIQKTEGVDGDPVDVYIGPVHDSKDVFVIHQNDPVTGRYDEDKTMIGFNNSIEAKMSYLRQYDRPGFFGSMDRYNMDEFKSLLKNRKGTKLKKSIKEKIMLINESTLDTGLELALEDLRKNLGELGGAAGATINKTEVLQKAREAVKSGKIDLMTAGVIEGRINKGISLDRSHRAALGLVDSARIEGLSSPAASSVESRMDGGKTPEKIGMGTGSPLPENSIVAEMKAKGKLLHSFQAMNGAILKVTGREILLKCRELVRKGEMSLMRAGDIERMTNTGSAIRPEILREIFAT